MPTEFERQQGKLIPAILGLDADIVGLMEVENNGSTAISSLVDALNDATSAGTYAYVTEPAINAPNEFGGTFGTDAIKVAADLQAGSGQSGGLRLDLGRPDLRSAAVDPDLRTQWRKRGRDDRREPLQVEELRRGDRPRPRSGRRAKLLQRPSSRPGRGAARGPRRPRRRRIRSSSETSTRTPRRIRSTRSRTRAIWVCRKRSSTPPSGTASSSKPCPASSTTHSPAPSSSTTSPERRSGTSTPTRR